MNLVFSYTVDEDHAFVAQGYRFLGAGKDWKGTEVHVFLIRGEKLGAEKFNGKPKRGVRK